MIVWCKDKKVGKPAFCGTKNRGIWVSCLQRQRGTI